MSREKKGSFAQEYIRRDLKTELTALLTNRRVIRAPFPVNPMDIYDAIWTPDERAAINVLKPYGSEMFDLQGKIHVNKIKWQEQRYRIIVNLPEDLPANADYWCEIDFAALPRSTIRAIGEWIPPWLELEAEMRGMLNKLDELSKHCKTFGQMVRIWPDLLSLLNKDGQSVIERARAKSRLPDTIMEWDKVKEEYVIADAFQPEAFASFVTPIAEALMLPMKEDIVEVATISRVG